MRKLYFSTVFLLLSCFTFAQNYTILGNATPLSGCNCFRLTPDANDQGGAIFQNNTINLNNSFDFNFNVMLGCNNGNDAADGIVFVLTNNPNGLGQAGGGLGYAGGNQPYSLAVEFDTWENGDVGDPSYDHIGIESGGLVTHNIAPPVPALANSGNIDNCQQYAVRIVWNVNTNTFQVYFNGVLRQSIVIPNIVTTYFAGNPIVNWGWTGSTGGGTNDQQVCVQNISNWTAGVNYQSCSTTMQFTDVSTSSLGNVQSWAWTFGDGGTSNLQNPSHTYAAPGPYTVSLTVTDITGCTNTFSHVVTINPPISLAPTLTQPLCSGGTDGSVSVTPTGGFGPSAGYGGYTYSWNGGVNLVQTYSGIGAGTYAVTVTDGVCTTTASYVLDQPTPLTAVISHTDANCNTNNGTASLVMSGGTTPYQTITWPAYGLSGSPVTGLAPGIYIPDFHDANNCSSLLQYTTTINSLPCGYNLSTASTDVSCFGGSNGSVSINVSGSGVTNPVTISWTRSGTPVGNTATLNNVIAGVYNYSWSDGSGQNFTGTLTVNQPSGAMAVSMTTLNTSCAGTNDGQALASVTANGDSPYNYAWSPAQPNAPSATGLSAGNYAVTVTDSKGCTAAATGTVTGPPTLTINVTSINDSCYQSHTGSATANAGGGTPPYTYYWDNISSAQTNLSLGAGTYNVTVTDDNGCTIGGSATITEPPAFTHTIAHQNVTCNGASTGSITLTPQGGTPAYSYTWNPATASGANPTNLAAGQYNVTITDNMGCQRLDSAILTQPATALSVTVSHTDVRCYGGSDGTVTFTVGGGTPPYTFMGNPIPPGTTTLTNVPPSTYAGNLTDANGCTFAVNETIGQPQPQSLNVTGSNNLCNGAATGSATANFVNATGAVNYSWSNSQTGATISNLIANTYNVTATDANTCSLTGTYTVTEPAAPVMTVNVTNATCFGGNGTATAQPSGGGTFTYAWSGTTATTATVNLPAGTNYTVTATDASQCNQTASFNITEPTGMTITDQSTQVACNGDSTGTIQLTVSGGTGPNYTYAWSPNVSSSSLATTLWAATYSITVTDQANCSQTYSVTITEPAQPLTLGIQSTNVPCFGQNNGSITLTVTGGTPNYTYAWSPNVSTGNSATGLSPGNYSITVTDANGCSAMPIITISEPSQPLALATAQTDLTCYQSNDGTATVTVTGGTTPYTYAWTGSSSTGSTATGLAAGPYTVTVTDNNLCTNTATYTLTQPTQLTATATPTHLQCNGDGTGQVDVTAAGGTPGYTYSWNPNVSTTNAATNLSAGAYSIIVTDTNGCTVTTSTTVNQPNVLTINASVQNVSCFGMNDATINTTTTGGTIPYSFSASDGTNNYNSPNGQFSNVAPGNYVVTVTDNNTCTATANAAVTQPAAVGVQIDTIPATCYKYADGQITLTPTGGTPQFNFVFSTGEQNTTGLLGGLAAGVYSFTVTDGNSCSLVDSAEITEPDSVIITVSPTPIEVELGDALPLTTTTNQSSNVSYYWQPALGLSCYDCANPTFEGVYSQTYTVQATTNAGCKGFAEFVVTVIPDYDIFFPNAFTPNGDGQNDYWQFFYTGSNSIKQIRVQVFNRIGEKVFEGNDIGFKWFGDYKGTNAPPGVYTYVANIVWLNNHNDNSYHGTITLIR